jgi:3-hydroxybutyryl-CoA dehydratase
MLKGPRARYWNEFEVGERIETAGRTIGEADVVLFTGLSGDFNPVHTNAEHAKGEIFGERIAHGLLTLSVSTGQCNQTGLFEGTTIGFLGMDNVRFTGPVRFGDTVFTTIIINEARVSSKPGRGILSMTIEVTNQKKESVMHYDASFVIAGPPD